MVAWAVFPVVAALLRTDPGESATLLPADAHDGPPPVQGDGCHAPEKGEQCYEAVTWAMENLAEHPEWYGGLVEGATFKEVQHWLASQEESQGCREPCWTLSNYTKSVGRTVRTTAQWAYGMMPHAEEMLPVGQRAGHLPCHTPEEGEPCYKAVMWALDVGLAEHPEWYGGLANGTATFQDVQRVLASQAENQGCREPCWTVGNYSAAARDTVHSWWSSAVDWMQGGGAEGEAPVIPRWTGGAYTLGTRDWYVERGWCFHSTQWCTDHVKVEGPQGGQEVSADGHAAPLGGTSVTVTADDRTCAEPTSCSGSTWTGGQLHGHHGYNGGRVSSRIVVDTPPGVVGGFFLYNLQTYDELDFEFLGGYYLQTNVIPNGKTKGLFATQFTPGDLAQILGKTFRFTDSHTYAIAWDDHKIEWLVDGVAISVKENSWPHRIDSDLTPFINLWMAHSLWISPGFVQPGAKAHMALEETSYAPP